MGSTDQLKIWDQQIKSGNAGEVLSAIRKTLERRRPPRHLLLPMAEMCRRAGAPAISLQLLRPLLRPPSPRHPQADSKEKAAYAGALVLLGVLPEAERLLKTIDLKEAPEALLYRAFAMFAQWNYQDAIPILNQYLQSVESSGNQNSGYETNYQTLVAQVNLAAALVSVGESEQAHLLLESVKQKAQASNYTLLLGNLLELSAQNSLFASQWSEAKDFLEQAAAVLKATPTADSLYVEKWSAILETLQNPELRNADLRLKKVKEKALQHKSWETVRECELFLSVFQKNVKLRDQVYFGTPFVHYRNRLLHFWPKTPQIPKSFDWSVGSKKQNSLKMALDLTNSAKLFELGLGPERLVTHLLFALASDFYKPFDISTLHGLVFPGNYFEPLSSSMRLYQLVLRLRQIFKSQKIAAEIRRTEGGYRLYPMPGTFIRVSKDLIGQATSSLGDKLRSSFESQIFSLADASHQLKIPRRTTSRQLKALIESGELLCYNRARATRYQFHSA